MATYSKAYITAIKFRKKLEAEGIKNNLRHEKITMLSYDTEASNDAGIFTIGDYAYVSSKTFEGLTDRAKLMVCKIMVELKQNNTLWKFDQRINARDSKVITELRDKEILYKSGTTDIHIVNPFFIRTGKPGNVIFQMINLLEKPAKVTTDHIKKLPWEGKIIIKGKHYIEIE